MDAESGMVKIKSDHLHFCVMLSTARIHKSPYDLQPGNPGRLIPTSGSSGRSSAEDMCSSEGISVAIYNARFTMETCSTCLYRLLNQNCIASPTGNRTISSHDMDQWHRASITLRLNQLPMWFILRDTWQLYTNEDCASGQRKGPAPHESGTLTTSY